MVVGSYKKSDVDAFNDAADYILSKVKGNWTPLQKASYIHDYIVTHTDYYYVNGQPGDKYDAYNVLVEHTAVCQGYAEAYQYLMNRIDSGYECDVISSTGLGHAWNMITVGGKKYYIDNTWDDPTGPYRYYCAHKNFMRSRTPFHDDCRHNTQDWVNINGDNVYDSVPGGTDYDAAPWIASKSMIPMTGNYGAYCTGYGNASLYRYDFSSGTSSLLANYSATWNVWGKTSYYTDNYSGLGVIGNYFVVTTPKTVLLIDKNTGASTTKYTLTSAEQSKGYIYGALIEGSVLNYDLYTGPQAEEGRAGSGTVDLSEYSTDIPVKSVTLSKSTLSMNAGETAVLTAKILPEDATDTFIVWKSSDPSKAKVSSRGVVTAVAKGNADITATCGGVSSEPCKVTVTGSGGDSPDVPDIPDVPDVPVSSNQPSAINTNFKADENKDIYLVKGQKYNLDPEYEWTSSDKTLVSVTKKYKISARAKGTASLTTTDGKYTFTAYVADPVLNYKKLTLLSGSQKELEFTELDNKEKYLVHWHSSNPDVARVKNGIVYAAGKGSAVVTAYLNGKAFNCSVKVKETAGALPCEDNVYTFKPMQTAKIPAKGFKYSKAVWKSSISLNEVVNAKNKVIGWQDGIVYIAKNGKITAIGVGTTELEAKDSNGNELKFSVKVSVPQSHVTFINVSKLKSWSFYNVKMKKVKWNSSDSSLADIKNGRIASGTVSGMATISGNYDPYNTGTGFDYTLRVYVEDPKWTADGLSSISATKYTMSAAPNKVYKLNASGIYQGVVFKSNNSATAFVDEYGYLRTGMKGKANITTKLNGKTYSIKVVVE